LTSDLEVNQVKDDLADLTMTLMFMT
jgi:hypothetical protein